LVTQYVNGPSLDAVIEDFNITLNDQWKADVSREIAVGMVKKKKPPKNI